MAPLFYSVILIVFFVNSGDSLWNNTRFERLKHDMEVLQSMREKLHNDIELARREENIFRRHLIDYTNSLWNKHFENATRIRNAASAKELLKLNHTNGTGHKVVPTLSYYNINDTEKTHLTHLIEDKNNNVNNGTNKITNTTRDLYKWPKFDEILKLAKLKYDWKNDRWIKLKNIDNSIESDFRSNSIISSKSNFRNNLKLKPKFIYRKVKLSNAGSKLKYIIAVSAIKT